MMNDREFSAARIDGFNEAVEEAALIADAPLQHRKGRPGAWRQRRAKIAAAIRALKLEIF